MTVRNNSMFYLLLLFGVATAQRSCSHGDLKLIEKSSANEGNLVELCRNGQWFPVCSSSLSVPSLICQQLDFSAKDASYASTSLSYTRSAVVFVCGGGESRLIECDHYSTSYCRQIRIRCVEHSNDTIPEIVSVSKVEAAAIMKWKLETRDELNHFIVKCSSDKHIARLLVDNQTYFAELSGLLPFMEYNCCVSAMFDSYKTQSCTSISTNIATQYTAAGSVGSASANNANTVGGILGFIIVVLSLLLLLAIVALVYPCVIRPRVQNYRSLSRLSDFLDHKVYGMSLTTSAKSFSKEEQPRSTSTHISSATAGRRSERSRVSTQHSDVIETYAEPFDYKQAVGTVTDTTETPRVYEPVAYTLPNTCLGQDKGSDITDHVYAALEEPIDDNN